MISSWLPNSGLLIIDYCKQPIIVHNLGGNLNEGLSLVIIYCKRPIVICSLIGNRREKLSLIIGYQLLVMDDGQLLLIVRWQPKKGCHLDQRLLRSWW